MTRSILSYKDFRDRVPQCRTTVIKLHVISIGGLPFYIESLLLQLLSSRPVKISINNDAYQLFGILFIVNLNCVFRPSSPIATANHRAKLPSSKYPSDMYRYTAWRTCCPFSQMLAHLCHLIRLLCINSTPLRNTPHLPFGLTTIHFTGSCKYSFFKQLQQEITLIY